MVTGDAEGQRLVALLRRAGETRVWRKKMVGGDGAGREKRSNSRREIPHPCKKRKDGAPAGNDAVRGAGEAGGADLCTIFD
ncbi:MAG: hypothetical protein DMG33_11745 [Acidobacteria bacterium]|nr:MAG: hypothetical protein DMG33_11745 [Acidobacteriota bacterium]